MVLYTNVANPPTQYSSPTIQGVSIDPSSPNAVYFTVNESGTYAFANTPGTPLTPASVQATMWTVSGQGGKYIAVNNGVMYVANYYSYSATTGNDSIYYVTPGSANVLGTILDNTQSGDVPDVSNCIGNGLNGSTAGMYSPCSSSVATPVNAFYTVLNDGSNCTNPPTIQFSGSTTTSGAAGSEFTAAINAPVAPATTTCSTSITDAAVFPTTITFSPMSPDNGLITATLTASDGTNSGTATVTGTAQNLTPQVLSNFAGITAPVYYGSGPYTLSATGGASTEPIVFSIDPNSTSGVAAVSGANGTTLTITGTGTLIIDVNQAGDGVKYAPATPLQETFTVLAASQTITFAPTSPIPYTTTPIPLTATGGGSGNPVTFTLVSGPGTLSGTNNGTLTITGLGAIVISADQAGTNNGDYTAAPTVTATIQVNVAGTVATPAISPASGTLYTNGSPSNTVTITDATTGAVIMYTTDGSDPIANPNGTAQMYTAPFTLAQSSTPYTVNAVATLRGYTNSLEATATYTISNLPPSFSASASPSAVDLSPGTSALLDITIGPNASFNGTVTFACSGAPSGVTCGFSPATLTAVPSTNSTTVLTITDAAASSANRHGPNPFIPGGATFALALCFFGFRKRRGLVLSLVLLAGIFGLTQLTGCGSGGGNSNKGMTSTTMTVTATSGSLVETVPITVTIQK